MMKRLSVLSRVLFLCLLLAAFSVSAQAPRAAPPNDDRANAMPIAPNDTFVVNDIEEATIQGGEAVHSCHPGAPSAGVNSVWFIFVVPQGTVTLDTADTAYNTIGSTSVDSIISVREFFLDTPVGCDNSGNASAGITLQLSSGTYIVQVSAVAGTPVTLDSSVKMTISFVPDSYVPANDSFASAQKLGLPTNIGILNMSSGTVEAGEADPTCATEGRTSNSFWYKFTLTKARTLLATVQTGNLGNDYAGASITTLSFALYNAPDGTLPEVGDQVLCGHASITANLLPAGSYYLRVSANTPGGTATSGSVVSFTIIVGAAVNVSFEVSADLSSPNDPLLAPWKLKGSSGDDNIVCGIAYADGDCLFRFTNTAGENTTLQIKGNLTDLKIKKGDILFGEIGYKSTVVPDATATITLTYADGSKTVNSLTLVQQPSIFLQLFDTLPIKSKPVSAVLKIKNKTQVGTLEIDLAAIVIARIATVSRDTLAAPSANVLPLPAAPGQ